MQKKLILLCYLSFMFLPIISWAQNKASSPAATPAAKPVIQGQLVRQAAPQNSPQNSPSYIHVLNNQATSFNLNMLEGTSADKVLYIADPLIQAAAVLQQEMAHRLGIAIHTSLSGLPAECNLNFNVGTLFYQFAQASLDEEGGARASEVAQDLATIAFCFPETQLFSIEKAIETGFARAFQSLETKGLGALKVNFLRLMSQPLLLIYDSTKHWGKNSVIYNLFKNNPGVSALIKEQGWVSDKYLVYDRKNGSLIGFPVCAPGKDNRCADMATLIDSLKAETLGYGDCAFAGMVGSGAQTIKGKPRYVCPIRECGASKPNNDLLGGKNRVEVMGSMQDAMEGESNQAASFGGGDSGSAMGSLTQKWGKELGNEEAQQMQNNSCGKHGKRRSGDFSDLLNRGGCLMTGLTQINAPNSSNISQLACMAQNWQADATPASSQDLANEVLAGVPQGSGCLGVGQDPDETDEERRAREEYFRKKAEREAKRRANETPEQRAQREAYDRLDAKYEEQKKIADDLAKLRQERSFTEARGESTKDLDKKIADKQQALEDQMKKDRAADEAKKKAEEEAKKAAEEAKRKKEEEERKKREEAAKKKASSSMCGGDDAGSCNSTCTALGWQVMEDSSCTLSPSLNSFAEENNAGGPGGMDAGVIDPHPDPEGGVVNGEWNCDPTPNSQPSNNVCNSVMCPEGSKYSKDECCGVNKAQLVRVRANGSCFQMQCPNGTPQFDFRSGTCRCEVPTGPAPRRGPPGPAPAPGGDNPPPPPSPEG